MDDLEKISEDLILLKFKDLALRTKLIHQGALSEGYHSDMEALHIQNANRLQAIIDQIGLPTADLVGEEAYEASWLIIQHAISLPLFMKHCLSLLSIAVHKGKASSVHLAYLTDRILTLEGKPQQYGTQFDWDEDGELSPIAYDHLELVNQRRLSIGMSTLEDQIKEIRARVQAEGHVPPSDQIAKRLRFNQWRKRVGWI